MLYWSRNWWYLDKQQLIPSEHQSILYSYVVAIDKVQEIWEVSSRLTFNLEEGSNFGLLKQLQDSMVELKQQLNKPQ